ncbi:MAG: TonB-dependent receptor plug domain-containing protein [Bradymonadia bacterium]
MMLFTRPTLAKVFAKAPAKVLVTALALSCASAPGQASAEEDELDLAALLNLNVVVAATGKAQSVRDAPAIISSINGDEIRAAGYRTVGEALRNIPGLSVIEDHVNTNVGVRGFFSNSDSANDIIKVMINSQPVAFRPTSSNYLGFDLIPIEAVQRIEVIRGPASALYGANAYLGVVNVVTKTGADISKSGIGGEAKAEAFIAQNDEETTFNQSGSFVVGGTLGKAKLMLSGTLLSADRSGLALPDPPASPGWGNTRAQEAFRAAAPSENDTAVEASVYGLGSLELDGVGTLTLDTHFQYRDKGGEFLGDTALTHGTRIAESNLFARLQFQSTRPKKGVGFYWDATLSYARSGPLEADVIIDESSPDIDLERNFGGQAIGGVLELNYGFSEDTILTVGFDIDHDMEDLLTIEEVDGNGVVNEKDGYGDRDFTNIAGYSQLILGLAEGLSLTAGARFDHNSAIVCNKDDDWDCFGSQTTDVAASTSGNGEGEETDGGMLQMSSRLAVVYNNEDYGFYTKVAYGSSYKAPTPYQLYHERVTRKGTIGEPSLTPQTADTFEGVAGYDITDDLTITLGGFLLEASNLVVSFQGANVGIESRNADASSMGIESGLTYSPDRDLVVKLNASYLLNAEIEAKKRAAETDTSFALKPFGKGAVDAGRYPDLMANLHVAYTMPTAHLRIGGNLNYVGGRNASLLNNMVFNARDLNDTYTLDPYMLARLNLSTTGLYLFTDEAETQISLMFMGTVLGDEVGAGFGGVDVPGLGPQVFLKINQAF